MRPLALAAIQAGLIDQETIAQFKRWGMVPRFLDTNVIEDPSLAIERIQFALEAEEQVRLQSTDLDLLRFYLEKENQVRGQLVIIDEHMGTKATKTVVFACRQRMSKREYIVPWVSESITDVITNGHTYLRYQLNGKSQKAYFVEVEELYFGNVKAFMVCTAEEEEDGES